MSNFEQSYHDVEVVHSSYTNGAQFAGISMLQVKATS
jgi:hypothetical protein